MEMNDAVTGPTIRKEGAEIVGGHTEIKIEGMTCDHCAAKVAQAIFDVPGVAAVKVFLDEARALYDVSEAVDSAAVAESVAKAGYKVVG
jgi:copper chaperone CopZ